MLRGAPGAAASATAPKHTPHAANLLGGPAVWRGQWLAGPGRRPRVRHARRLCHGAVGF